MLNWTQLHERLGNLSSHHSQLAEKFQSFAKHVEKQVTTQAVPIKGITVSLHLDDGYFTTAFAGRTLRFSFSSAFSKNGPLAGTVTCVLMKYFPEKMFVPVGDFTFAGNGKTNLFSQSGGYLFISDDDADALCVALNFIHESLLK